MCSSDLLPNLSGQADELCVIHSMHTDLPNHAQAFTQMHTGSFQFIRPSVGAWTLFGLGTENAELPGFITLSPPSDNGGARNYGCGFLPAICQATKIGTNQIPGFYAALPGIDREPGPPLRNIENPWPPRPDHRHHPHLTLTHTLHPRPSGPLAPTPTARAPRPLINRLRHRVWCQPRNRRNNLLNNRLSRRQGSLLNNLRKILQTSLHNNPRSNQQSSRPRLPLMGP